MQLRLKSNWSIRPLINYFGGVSIVSCSFFVCLSAYCLSYSLNVALYAFTNKIGNMLNNTQNLSDSNARFGLKQNDNALQIKLCANNLVVAAGTNGCALQVC